MAGNLFIDPMDMLLLIVVLFTCRAHFSKYNGMPLFPGSKDGVGHHNNNIVILMSG